MGMVVQHNISALNANNAMTRNVSGLGKSTEKLSTGYQINRAADNAAGLAISEKMRSQIRGLSQATNNANDAISLIQTAEGGLQETEDILQRMRELSVQSANGTYTDEDREQIQFEVDALKGEIDRIAESTEFNEMKLLDGSLGGAESSTEYGAKFGVVSAADDDLKGAILTSNFAGVKVKTNIDGASGKGGENAVWDKTGKELTLNLVTGETYTQKQIDDLIANAAQDKAASGAPAEVSLTLKNGVMTATKDSDTTATVAGVRAASDVTDIKKLVGGTTDDGALKSADQIKFTANTYGTPADTNQASKITISTDVGAGKEDVTIAAADKPTEITLHLSTGVEYTEKDIENILAKAGYDYTVDLSDAVNPDGDSDNKVLFNVSGSTDAIELKSGTGVGKNAIASTGEGLTFQIGANGVEDQRLTVNIDDMGASALGVANIDVSKQEGANAGINKIDDAIKTVSTQRAKLGAVQNRLEHTVNSLNTAGENLTSAESQIRDTDMASEMIKYTKSNILQQASQSMLAQANQQPQGVLQLLG